MRRLLAIGAIAAAAAFAQTSGSITVGGTTPEAFSITNASDGALSSTLTLASLTPANNGTLVAITPVEVHLRSNKAYKLTAGATFNITGPGAADGGLPITPADIGFGIETVDGTGANVANTPRTATGTDTIAGGYDYTTTAVGSTPVTDGLTPFDGTTKGNLAGIIGSGIPVISGKRISAKGNIETPNNFLKLKFGVATLPQYFTPNTSFSAVISLAIATP